MGTLKTDLQQIHGQFNSIGLIGRLSGDRQIAQIFTPTVTANLDKLTIAIDKIGTPGGDLVVEIQSTSAGAPSTAVLASENITEASITDRGRLEITFSTPASLTASVDYAIVIYNADGLGGSPSATDFYAPLWSTVGEDFIGSGITTYASSDGGSSFIAQNTQDLAFLTEMSVSPVNPVIDQVSFCEDTSEFVTSSTTQVAQTFTPSVNGDLIKVKVHISRVDSQTGGNVNFKIQGVDGGGEPDGTDIASESVADTSIGTGTATGDLEVTFSTPATVVAFTQLALVIEFPNASGSARYNLLVFPGSSGNFYTGGREFKSSDSGSTWGDGTHGADSDVGFVSFIEELVTTEQTINSDATIQITTEQTINSDAFIGEETTQNILSDASVASEVEQSIDSDAFIGEETTQSINSDAQIQAEITQTINSDATIQITTEQTIDADTNITATITQSISAKASVAQVTTQTIDSGAQVIVQEPELKMFSAAAPTVEVGTASNPIIFTGVLAGENFAHPDNPFLLFNDKGGSLGSVDAREIKVRVISFNIIDELVGQSDGSPSQQFVVAFPPAIENEESDHPLVVKVNDVVWASVSTFTGAGSSEEVYTFDFVTGTVTFGDNVEGKIPPLADPIEISYTPDQVDFGVEIEEFNWLGVQSTGVINNDRTVTLERQISSDANTVQAAHTPITEVTSVFLNTDPGGFGTNFFSGGTFDPDNGVITLGTALPSATETVLITYKYEIDDDVELIFSQVGQNQSHTFINPIPSNNAKKINLQLSPPAETSPSGAMNLQFTIRLDFKA